LNQQVGCVAIKVLFVLPRILIVAGQNEFSESACSRLLQEQAECEYRLWEDFAPDVLIRGKANLIIIHAGSATERVLLLLRSLQQSWLQIPVLAILPENLAEHVRQLVSEVAADFLFSPLREEELTLRVVRLLGAQASAPESLEQKLRTELGLNQLVGSHPSFLHAVQQALLFAASEAPVLITGETGTGKELFAHAIHSLGRRRDGPFIPLDCGTLPEHLAENELFGHRRGAYTDASADQKGLAAMADGGTLFLDEIDALSPANQSKFLRFLQEGTYRPLGSERMARADFRIIAATNRPIEDSVQQRQFRNDLYFRINVLRLTLPPLRERRSDVRLLTRYFLESECADSKLKSLSTAAARKLETYSWPGNVRELRNAVQRAVACSPGEQIRPEHVFLEIGSQGDEHDTAGRISFRSAKQIAIEKFEHAYVESLLLRFQGNITRAAREAGKERRAFGRLVKKYGVGCAWLARTRDDHGVGHS
jgi:two-component system response regulator GlrR